MIGIASASVAPKGTDISGTIYMDVNHNNVYDSGDTPIDGATVTVTCNEHVAGSVTSDEYGLYSVPFNPTICPLGAQLSVSAVKGDLNGLNTGTVTDYVSNIRWNIGVVDVPMVPEFGLFAGAVTILSAVAIFFVVRKK
jgi:hypothetical protein